MEVRQHFRQGFEMSIENEITDYINRCGGSSAIWYVGRATNPRDKLFNDHNVQEEGGAWIYRDAGSESQARSIEKYFLDLGSCGGFSGGDNPTYVYAYKITRTTRE